MIVLTSDSNNPQQLPGMREADQLRSDLGGAAIALRDVKGIRGVNMGKV
ncbi:hypothetical protein [Paraburkholderia antibiotica]|nr:hypothetical protein [Paraburkholderia antibiotica]